MSHLQSAVEEGVKSWPVQPRIVVGEQDKRAAFRIAHAALVKSGTVTLELALAGVPMVAAYRVGNAEAWVVRRAIRTSSIILANLVIGENVVPEFVQENCTPEKLLEPLREILTDITAAPATNPGFRQTGNCDVDRRPAAKRARLRYRAGHDAEGAAGELDQARLVAVFAGLRKG